MNQFLRISLLNFFLLLPFQIAHAETSDQTQQRENLLKPCALCHGEKGASTTDDVPHLDRQQADYLVESMELLSQKKRPSSLPEHIPATWAAKDIKVAANFYSMARASRETEETDEEKVAAGREIFLDRCETCHENNGRESDSKGAGSARLAEQRIKYLQTQMRAFLERKREFLPAVKERAFSGKPIVIASKSVGEQREKLTEKDIDLIAHFLAATPLQAKEKSSRRKSRQ